MTIAFVLQTYKNLDQVELLARTLARGTRDRLTVVAHRGSAEERSRLSVAEGVDRVIPSPGGRGRFGVLDGLISSMRWLERQPKPYDWLLVMSGQDFPIRPLHELEAELDASSLDGYFHHFEAFDAAQAGAPPMLWSQKMVAERYLYTYAWLKENISLTERALLKVPRLLLERLTPRVRIDTGFGIMLGRRATELPFDADFRLYGGNFWMTVSRKAARTVLDFVDDRPDIVNYFRGVAAPEEAFLPTVLANDARLKLSRRELRYAEFDQCNYGFLAEFRAADLDRVLASGCYIARKFDFGRDPDVRRTLEEIVSRPAPGEAARAAARS
jgi:hypothetical protein